MYLYTRGRCRPTTCTAKTPWTNEALLLSLRWPDHPTTSAAPLLTVAMEGPTCRALARYLTMCCRPVALIANFPCVSSRIWSQICTYRRLASIRNVKRLSKPERPWSNTCTPTSTRDMVLRRSSSSGQLPSLTASRCTRRTTMTSPFSARSFAMSAMKNSVSSSRLLKRLSLRYSELSLKRNSLRRPKAHSANCLKELFLANPTWRPGSGRKLSKKCMMRTISNYSSSSWLRGSQARSPSLPGWTVLGPCRPRIQALYPRDLRLTSNLPEMSSTSNSPLASLTNWNLLPSSSAS